MPTTGFRLNGAELQKRRLALRLTSAEVARALELTPTFYSRVEAGKGRVSLKTLGIIEGYFGADPEDAELVHPEERHLFVGAE